MQRLLINRIPLKFEGTAPVLLVLKRTEDFSLNKNRAGWVKEKLSDFNREKMIKWMKDLEVGEADYIETEFLRLSTYSEPQEGSVAIELSGEGVKPFRIEIFKQELGQHFIKKGFFIDPVRKSLCLAAYQRLDSFDADFDHYRRIDVNWKPRRNELSFNFGSERTLITQQCKQVDAGETAFDIESKLAYRAHDGTEGKAFCPWEIRRRKLGAPQKFSYQDRFRKLTEFSASHLFDFSSPFFHINKTGFKHVDPDGVKHVSSDHQNMMSFSGDKAAINAVVGMREYGPLKKADNAKGKRLLFIYQNRNDANLLYRYLKNGLKHFPGLLSYVGIPVALAEPVKGLPYKDPASLPERLAKLLDEYYPDDLYDDTLAIVIGPFKRYESNEEESGVYFQVKKILLDKGIASQFVSPDTINSSGVHYSLPNIAIGILAKFGGVPWKLSRKRTNELVVGFNTKLVEGDQFLGSAVFFDNEGRLCGVRGLPVDDKVSMIRSLRDAITHYTSEVEKPDRLVIHYYKPPRRGEVADILNVLEEMELSVPIAIVEVNDSKSKLDICFDQNFNMGMPESGVSVRVGPNEYLLFNNNRYKKTPPRKIDDELPIKLRLSYVNTGGFTTHELIAQVYEFSRLNWKGLRQRSVPVTTTYSKAIAEFASHFNGQIPDNEVAKRIPWFI